MFSIRAFLLYIQLKLLSEVWESYIILSLFIKTSFFHYSIFFFFFNFFFYHFCIGKLTKICTFTGRSTNLHPDNNINFPYCRRCNNVRIKITKKRKILGEVLVGKKWKSYTFYWLLFTKEKTIQPRIKHSLFISKTLHAFA